MASHIPHSCRCSGSWRRSYRLGQQKETFALIDPGKTTSEPREITGTWDFKWPQATIIRVAFQAHPSITKGVVEKLMQLAEQWTIDPSGSARTSVQFKFDADPFPAPRNPEMYGSMSPAEPRARNYDVLISLAPLPTFEAETPGDPRIVIDAPTSQLGSYALRADYGVPTTYLGCPQGLGDSTLGEAVRVREYFDSPLFAYAVTHEFGHILGLPHEHQNPNANLTWANRDRIRQVMQAAWGLPDGHSLLSDEYIESEITLPWPGGNHFSDWRTAAKTVPVEPSIMAHPLYRYFLEEKSRAPLPEPLTAIYAPQLSAPTATDIEHIESMYPRGEFGSQEQAAQ